MIHRRYYAIGGVTAFGLALCLSLLGADPAPQMGEKVEGKTLNIRPQPISSDPSVKYDYDIVYVRAPRKGDDKQIGWPDIFNPLRAEPGSDLVVLHPNGSEEVLVTAGLDAVADPFVSFDGQWVFYARFHNVRPGELLLSRGADIFKIHVKTRKVIQLTHQEFTPNTGVSAPNLIGPSVYNLGPCPLPGGKVIFTSTRNGFVATKDYKHMADLPGHPGTSTLQLFTMDNDGSNVELVGSLNINGALHPTILKDGRVAFSSFESEALKDIRMWAIWTINPDGTNWGPLFSALGASGKFDETARHFMTQLSDGNIVAEEYYFQTSLGFGTYFKMSPNVPQGDPYFGSASQTDPRNFAAPNGSNILIRLPFTPHGFEELTPFAHSGNAPAHPSNPNDPKSPRVGKVTHPSAAPDNNLLTVWSPGPVYGVSEEPIAHPFTKPAIDSGIYLIKGGKRIDEPGQMLLIKNDPRYNEQWPRALVPYKRIYGVDEPAQLTPVLNNGKLTKELPEGTPYGLVGSASLYKRETYPFGDIPERQVTARSLGGGDPYEGLGSLSEIHATNWFTQGADAGKYENSDIHAIRIVITEPTTDPSVAGKATRRWWNAANERLSILGEFPVRKFNGHDQPLDPDGNPDTSFLVKIPADVAWTFQTLDKNGMVLNMAETWHQLRPGEIRNNCGGCHAHSQKPTPWEETAAAKLDYPVFDLTKSTPLLTTKKNDQSGKKWDVHDETGLRFEKGVKNVEYFRDVKPIIDRSCISCHTQKWNKPAGNLVLDDDRPMEAEDSQITASAAKPPDKIPGTYLRLALDEHGMYGYGSGVGDPPDRVNGWAAPQASRYVRYFQSRRSLLVWKIFGQRMDGFSNDDFAYEKIPGDPSSMIYKGKPYPMKDISMIDKRSQFFATRAHNRLVNLAYTGTAMPPPTAVAGTYKGPDGKLIKVPPLSDEDRLTIVRWIDLGCPIDFDFNPAQPRARGAGWLADDNRPTLTLTYPRPNANTQLTRLLVGMHDYDSGLDMNSFSVVADFDLNGLKAGTNLASRFKVKSQGVWELTLSKPLTELANGQLFVSVKDKQGNLTRIERKFSVKPESVNIASGQRHVPDSQVATNVTGSRH